MDNAKAVLDNVEWCASSYEAIENADALVIVTEWNEFRGLDLDRVEELLNNKIMIDLRNIYKLKEMNKRGFHYISIGRPEIHPDQEKPEIMLQEVAQ